MPGLINPFFQDTINTSRPSDTIVVSREITVRPTDSVLPAPGSSPVLNQNSRTTVIKPVENIIRIEEHPAKKTIQPEKWNTSTNFLIENGLKGIVSGINDSKNKSVVYGTKDQPKDMIPAKRNNQTYDWMLGIFLFLVILFVWIRIFYSKFFSTLASAMISFQLSVKLFQERNVLSQRVSIVLDFIYIIVSSVFIFELIEYSGTSRTGMTGINLFLLLLNIFMLYAILRVVVLRLTGSLFMAFPLFSEYIHNTFVINKGLGILLFPVVIMAHYLPYSLIPVVLVLGIVLFSIALLFKSFRAYQIIIRRDIVIFYLILYLCTLEILPLLLGYKFVTSLIQSN